MELPKKGIYRHFKGNRYELIDFAINSETEEIMVLYRPLYGEMKLWVRPLKMWSEKVERDGKVYTRFVPEDEFLERLEQEAAPPTDMDAPPEQEFYPPEYDGRAFETVEPEPAYDESTEIIEDKNAVLKRVYGYDSFLEGQERIIDSIIAGRDTLAVLPTGGGKSICYQIPALIMRGITIVVSPLISLMADQVSSLKENGVGVAYINSVLTERQIDEVYRRMSLGAYKIVYVAPERLQTQRFLNVLQGIRVAQIAVDEAHCISQWGQDFRPSYMNIPQFIRSLDIRPVVTAFTATATEKVREDIKTILELKNPQEVVTSFDRKNLYLAVRKPANKRDELLKLLQSYKGLSGIVYCATRKQVEEICELLVAKGFSASRYHAGLSESERMNNQEDFIYDRVSIIVATNAFGMGINKPDVRYVIHYNMPGDIESYYQEAGRAGRDGERADCILLSSDQDIVLRSFMIDKIGEEADLTAAQKREQQERARFRLNTMVNYCKTTHCLKQTIMGYFGEKMEQPCRYCSSCLEPKAVYDVTEQAKYVLRCVQNVRSRFGKRMVIDILRGSQNRDLLNKGLNRVPEYGMLSAMSVDNVRFVIEALEQINALGVTQGDYPLLVIGSKANSVLNGEMMVEAHLAEEKTRGGKSAEKKRDSVRSRSSGNSDLYEKLKKLRKQLADARGIPAYRIFTDDALHDMARKKPTTVQEFLNVSGVGEKKAASFGKVFLEVIRENI